MDNLAEESESFPNGFSTITLDHPEGDMHVFLIAVVTDSNTDGGKAEEKKKIKIYSAVSKFFLYNYYVVVLT